jgi:hypothetical protein
VLVAVSNTRFTIGRASSARDHASTSRAPNFDAITGGGTGTSPALGAKPPVAVYFTGQARTLRRTLCSIRRHVFDPLVEQNFVPVVFVAGERDDDAADYELLLGHIPNVELGGVRIVDRPKRDPSEPEKSIAYLDLPQPALDPALPSVPSSCVADFKKKGRWFHAGGDGSRKDSKNAVYSEEVLSQLWYRSVVDRMRRNWSASTERGRKAGTFRWIVVPRPDNVYVNDLPDLRETRSLVEGDDPPDARHTGNSADDAGAFVSSNGSEKGLSSTATPRNVSGTIFVPSWGKGYDPLAPAGGWIAAGLFGSPRRGATKRRPGVNNRFSFGGVAAMEAYHDLYPRMCHDGLSATMPSGMNFEQMVQWYFDQKTTSDAGVLEVVPLPKEFWFLRLRRGEGTTPVENPGHEPAMVADDWGRDAKGIRAFAGARGSEIVDAKRWEVWSSAAREVWRCDDGVSDSAGEAEQRGECLVREMRSEWMKTAWLRRITSDSPFSRWVRMMAMPGGWLEGKIRKRCGS